MEIGIPVATASVSAGGRTLDLSRLGHQESLVALGPLQYHDHRKSLYTPADLRVQDDFRFGVDRNKTSVDTKSIGEGDEKVSQVLAQTIMNAAMKTEGSEKLLSELLAKFSHSEQRDAASSVEIAADFLKPSKSGYPAPLMQQAHG